MSSSHVTPNANPFRAARREDLEARLPARAFGRPLYWVDEVDSTNRVLLEWATEGYPEGTVLVADYQTAGRGRRGRRWVAPPGTGLLLSVLLRPRRGVPLLPLLTGVAVAEAVEACAGVRAELKWPNDVLVSGRKVAGILAEAVTEGEQVSVVVGVGINVSVPREVLATFPAPATSLHLEADHPISREELLLALLSRWKAHYDQLQLGEWSLNEWKARAPMLGKPVRVETDGESWEGVALDVTEEGALLVRDTDGNLHTVYAGDVTVRLEGQA